jgi:putative peptide zinc metalloprotease protein
MCGALKGLYQGAIPSHDRKGVVTTYAHDSSSLWEGSKSKTVAELQQETNSTCVERPVQLTAGTELIRGSRGESLLYVEHRRAYLRISPLAAEVIRQLADSPRITVPALIVAIHKHCPQVSASHDLRLVGFIEELIRAEAVQFSGGIAEVAREQSRRIVFQPRSRLPLRVRLFRPKQAIAPALARWLGRKRIIFLIVVATLGCAGLSYHAAGPSIMWNTVAWPFLVLAILLHASLHECSHALASSFFGIQIRDAGVAVLYWFIPVFYVDRTDSYRLRDCRQRGWIALAGPMFDVCGCGLTALVSWNTTGNIAANFGALSICQLFLLFSNLNPFLPTDGYHAVEAFTGEFNVRRRAFLLLLSRLRLRALPAYLQTLSPKKRLLYGLYGLASAVYLAVFALAVLIVGYKMIFFISEHFK